LACLLLQAWRCTRVQEPLSATGLRATPTTSALERQMMELIELVELAAPADEGVELGTAILVMEQTHAPPSQTLGPSASYTGRCVDARCVHAWRAGLGLGKFAHKGGEGSWMDPIDTRELLFLPNGASMSCSPVTRPNVVSAQQ
jgi:hypothetical protein